ncbi:MAG: S9 family peptidase [Verrucomicrobia bacterium]|nr:S9 family peptidase [Verrucomicrobiota bacterium]
MLRRAFLLVLVLAPLGRAQVETPYRTPSAPLAALVNAPLTPFVVLNPDRSRLLLLERAESPGLAELAQPELRLAGLRIDPAINSASRAAAYTGLVLQSVADGTEQRITGLPADARVPHYQWSRNGKFLAFTVARPKGLELWVAEVATARARALTPPVLNGVFGEPLAWLDDETLIVRRVPAQRTPPPAEPPVPAGPVVQENLGRRAAARTYQDLLANARDEALFEYHGATELVLIAAASGTVTPLGVTGLITVATPSPDGRHILVESLHRPFSYLVPSSRFPTVIDVIALDGRREHRLADLPLNEGGAIGAVRPGPRNVTWRGDTPATLSWVQALDRGETTDDKKAARDAWFTHAAPFAGAPVEQQKFEFRAGTVTWGDDTLALVTETWTRTRITRTWRVAPGRPGGPRELLSERSTQERFKHPGEPVRGRNQFGRLVIQRSADGGKIFLAGAGATPEGDRPFLDEFDLGSKQTRRLWRSAPPVYEEFIAFTDASLTRALMRRESAQEPDNYCVRDLTRADGALRPLTRFPNPFPQFAGVKSEVLRYKRADGVALSGTLHLPPGWTPAQGPLPTLLWAYPREYLSAEMAEQVTPTAERFTRISVSGPLPFLLDGYAVLNDPTMPIIARPGGKPNDTYIEQLVASAQAAVDELVRRGVTDPKRVAVGGHSYGAFMTANLLAHSRIFRAGIARSGAYNRTLTPFGFQSEERTFWQAPQVYAAMSPFNFADKVKDPLLLIHGEADNNAGTFPIQSERFYNALKGHGATTRFVLLPHESHGYRAKESLLHMLWEMETWLDLYVKDSK